MDKVTFYMRFYGQSREQVVKYAREFQEMFPLVVNYRVELLTVSVNADVPKNSFEVTLEFNTAYERDRVRQSEQGRRWYVERAYLKPGAKFVERNPGDVAFKVGGQA